MLYLLFGSGLQKPTISGTILRIFHYEYNTIHHTLGTKYTSYHILKVRYGGDFYNLLYLIIHSHKVHIHVHDLTSKTFEPLIGCRVQNLICIFLILIKFYTVTDRPGICRTKHFSYNISRHSYFTLIYQIYISQIGDTVGTF